MSKQAPSPGFRLQVSCATDRTTLLSDASVSDLMIVATDGPTHQSILAGFSRAGSNPSPAVLRIDPSNTNGPASVSVEGNLYARHLNILTGGSIVGNVGIGKTNPEFPLDVIGHIRASGNIIASGFRLAGGGVHASSLVGATLSSCTVPYTSLVGAPWQFDQTGSVVMLGCNVGIGTSNPAFILDVVGTIRATGGFTAFSDERYKTDLRTIKDAIGKVRGLTGYTYQMKSDPPLAPRQMGVLAQDVRRAVPELVQGDDEMGLSVSYGNMGALLIEAIKSLDARIDGLEALVRGRQG